MKKLVKFLKNNKGATAIEYGLIAALVSVVIIGTVTTMGGSLKQTFTKVSDELVKANATGL